MTAWRGAPWVAVVLTSAGAAGAQATVDDEPAAAAGSARSSIAQAARDRRSISLSSAAVGPGDDAPELVPEYHAVQRGDTLWDITGRYFANPWRWPAVWGLNPHVTNPHWIFPGDRVRLLSPEQAAATAPQGRAAAPGSGVSPGGEVRPRRPLTPQTVFLRDEGWVDRAESDNAGTIVGAPGDQMLLSEGDQAYVEFPRRTPRVGEVLTVYQDGQNAHGGDRQSGHVVRVLGTARVEHWDPDRRIATMRLTESLDGVERGERLAAVPRQLQVVPPVRNTTDLRAHIVATVQPRELVGQNMVVFVDRGRDDGVRVGNRFTVVRRGDAWRRTLIGVPTSAAGTGLDRDGDGNVDAPPGHSRADGQLPEEVVGELLVVDARGRSCTALVTSSIVEVSVGDMVELRRGY